MTLVRSSALVFATSVVEVAVNFIRNIILARLLSVEDFGTAATFALLASLLDLAGQIGLGQLVVQARDAEDPKMQATLHTVQFALGLVAALLLLAMAWPYAFFMAAPGLFGAYAMLALIPIMRGLSHLDNMRLQRHGRFGPWAIRQIVPPILSLLVIYPAYLWLGDYRIVLVTIYVQQLGLLIASHYGADWRYAFGFDRDIIRRALHFGWPLMLNSLLMYFVFNGDRIVVSNQLGLEALGWFSAAVFLTMTPMNFVAKTAQTVLLPTMARQQDNPAAFQRQYDLAVSFVALMAVAFTAGLALLGGPIMHLTFGTKFLPAEPYLTLLAVTQGIRLIRAAPALAAMAKGETKNPFYTNMIRGVFVLVALGVTIVTKSIYLLIFVGIVGEIVATIAGAWLLKDMLGVRAGHFHVVLAASLVACGIICSVSLFDLPIWLIVPAALIALYPTRGALLHGRRLLARNS